LWCVVLGASLWALARSLVAINRYVRTARRSRTLTSSVGAPVSHSAYSADVEIARKAGAGAVCQVDRSDEYAKRATPPTRFTEALTGDGPVICLSRNCEFPMVMDPAMFSMTRAMVREWRRNNTDPVPLRLLNLAMRCMGGHVEVWHAEPALTREAAAALAEAEEVRYQGALTGKRCTACGDRYHGTKYSLYCSECRVAAS